VRRVREIYAEAASERLPAAVEAGVPRT